MLRGNWSNRITSARQLRASCFQSSSLPAPASSWRVSKRSRISRSNSGSFLNHASRNSPYPGSPSRPNQNSRTSSTLVVIGSTSLGTADHRYILRLAGEGPALETGAVSAKHPDLGYDLRDQLPVVEHPHRRVLRDRHRHRARVLGDRGCRHVPAAQPQGDVEAVGDRVYVAGRREHHALIRDHESPVELGELLQGLAHVRVVYALALVGVTEQWVQDHGPGASQDGLGVADDEERPELASLPSCAISTASATVCSSTREFTSRLSEQISSNNFSLSCMRTNPSSTFLADRPRSASLQLRLERDFVRTAMRRRESVGSPERGTRGRPQRVSPA